jgi:D-3-phosphoglycerate dehydrogenase
MKNFNLIFDFDSTIVQGESLEHLADISLNGAKDKRYILNQIKEITDLGMSGKIPFKTSLQERLNFFRPKKQHIKELISLLKKSITPSVLKNKDFFKIHRNNIYIISGGFIDYIFPVVRDFEIKKSHVFGNKFDFKRQKVTIHNKVNLVRSLRLDGQVFVIGDGYTDWEIKKSGLAQKFFAFTENITREEIVQKADYVVHNFDEFLRVFNRLI